jgi:hypothetical protein
MRQLVLNYATFELCEVYAVASVKYEFKYIHDGVCNKLAKIVIVLNFSAFLDRVLPKLIKNPNLKIGPKTLLMNHQLSLYYKI